MTNLRGLAMTIRTRIAAAPLTSMLVHSFGSPKVIGIAWHGVTKQPLTGIDNYSGKHLDVRQFERQLVLIAAQFRIISASEVVESLLSGQSLEPRTAFLTFDDGYRGLSECALEILCKHKVTATVFLPTSFIEGRRLDVDVLDSALKHTNRSTVRCLDGAQLPLGTLEQKLSACRTIRLSIRRNRVIDYDQQFAQLISDLGFASRDAVPPLSPDEQSLTWDQIRQMQSEGIEFGSHTHSHRSMASMDYHLELAEVTASKSLIEQRTGRTCSMFAYPYGKPGIDDDENTHRAVVAAGYKAAFVTGGGHIRAESNVFALRRNCLTARTTEIDLRSILATAGHSVLHRKRF